MKLKQIPEDFIVEEVLQLHPDTSVKSGSSLSSRIRHKIYLLKKSGIETMYLLDYIARKRRIPRKKIGISGMKDKHALTTQYISIPSAYDIQRLSEKNFTLEFVGYSSQKISLGDHSANRFKITVRDIKKGEIEGIYEKAKSVQLYGVPNYFDSQRFGSFYKGGSIGRDIVKRDYENAVKMHLTMPSRFESRHLKDERKRILAGWSNLEFVNVANPALRLVINEYRHTHSWLSAYLKIKPELRQIYISAYQSYLWNECVKKLIFKCVKRKFSVDYKAGTLLFYKSLSESEREAMPESFPTISDELLPAGLETELIGKVLSKDSFSLADFKIKEETGNFFKTHKRKVLLMPEGFTINSYQVDELNDRGRGGAFKILVEFTLPKGSYATIIIKRVFCLAS